MIMSRVVPGDPFAGFEAEVQTVIMLIAFLQKIHNPEALNIVFKAPVILQEFVQVLLARVAEGGMAEIMGISYGLAEVFIEAKGAGKGPRMLGHFQGMGKPRPVKIPFGNQKYLGFVLQILEDLGVENAIPVPLKAGPVIVRLIAVQRPAQTQRTLSRKGARPSLQSVQVFHEALVLSTDFSFIIHGL